ncbi:MAG: hypothetical protein R8G66_23040 [Cytophagales bacterium]|nr:hypothetical protein [Cytophagales bacterium]
MISPIRYNLSLIKYLLSILLLICLGGCSPSIQGWLVDNRRPERTQLPEWREDVRVLNELLIKGDSLCDFTPFFEIITNHEKELRDLPLTPESVESVRRFLLNTYDQWRNNGQELSYRHMEKFLIVFFEELIEQAIIDRQDSELGLGWWDRALIAVREKLCPIYTIC